MLHATAGGFHSLQRIGNPKLAQRARQRSVVVVWAPTPSMFVVSEVMERSGKTARRRSNLAMADGSISLARVATYTAGLEAACSRCDRAGLCH